MINLNMKWNDYREQKSESLYLFDGKTLYSITEGDGSNLNYTDEEDGYKDYWMTDSYTMDGEALDGGQWMEKELITDLDYTIKGVIERLQECDIPGGELKIIDPKVGDKLFNYLSDISYKQMMVKMIIDENIVIK